jgi:hypothetical protein
MTARLEVEIDVDGDAEHVRGTIRSEGGERVSFVGWIGLMALLQQAVS